VAQNLYRMLARNGGFSNAASPDSSGARCVTSRKTLLHVGHSYCRTLCRFRVGWMLTSILSVLQVMQIGAAAMFVAFFSRDGC